MPSSNVTLEILQPGPRALELVAAVAAAYGVETPAVEDGFARFSAPAAYPVARQRAQRALFLAGDGAGEVVRVLTGQ